MIVERKELKKYTIGEAMEICGKADSVCWIHGKHHDYPNADYMERCPFYDASSDDEPCIISRGHEPADWDVQIKPLDEYTIKELVTKCYRHKADCNKLCMFAPVCKELRVKAPANWDI